MQIENAINYALEGEAILFAGSGFSFGAKNINGENFRTGETLKSAIAKKCGVPAERPLSVLTQYFRKKYSVDELIQFIKNEFSLSSVAQWHDDILAVNWKRIYTTNYDFVIEKAAEHNSKILSKITLSSGYLKENIENVCIHLNGHIDNLNKNTLDNEFKLIDTSYSCDELDGNRWFELFKDDVHTAKAIIIIGYSMQFDVDIKRILADPIVNEKVIFIDRPNPEEVDKMLLEEYGTCEFIGIEKFAETINKLKQTYVKPVIQKQYQCFKFEYRESFHYSPISFNELNEFYKKGKYTDSLLDKNHGEYLYVILRSRINYVIRELYNTRVFLITSDLGNGKTMFCNLLRNELREHEVNVFSFKHRYNTIDDEINRITSENKAYSVVVIDDYKNKIDILQKFKYKNIDRITFILTTRKSVNPNHRKLLSSLDISEKDIKPIGIDLLEKEEIRALSNVILNNTLYNSKMEAADSEHIEEYIQKTCHSRFADLLLEAYKSSDIKERIVRLWEESKDKEYHIKQLAILSLIKTVMGIDFNLSDLLELLKIDYVMLNVKDDELLKEFFNFENNDVEIKSSVVARELLKSAIGINELINTMKLVIIQANTKYKDDAMYDNLLRNLISHSHFRMFDNTTENITAILNFYNDIRNLTFCKENLFYWEQFAAACIDMKHFDDAEQCIENAFTIAKGINGFVPFHIENIKANCLIEKLLFESAKENKPDADKAIKTLQEAHRMLMNHFDHPDNNISYIFRIGSKYINIFNIYESEFNSQQKSIFIEKKVEMLKVMKQNLGKLEYANNHPLKVWIEGLELCK